ncbi:hypothetical protein IWQ60_008461 [Tieghemiomyces parasiticus]|uniref:Translin n=1 Tax=Tieghemiomyces parasiticus TaxID=78921 RepID=A0A9W8DRZ9_9FUNG|nr:hypothetical protein IWQ60_008461 [Tieghemiomyces parasiticus]
METALFTNIRDTLDAHYDRRERLNKLSRDITQLGKKLIFHLLRITPSSRDRILAEAEKKHEEIRRLIGQLGPDLQGSDRYRYAGTVTGGLQEYIEALALWRFLEAGRLVTVAEVEARINGLEPPTSSTKIGAEKDAEDGVGASVAPPPQPLAVLPEDYVLGIADVAGELMRYAINSLAKGQRDEAIRVCDFFRQFYNEFSLIDVKLHKQMPKKVEVMKESLAKVENVQLQISEFPNSTRAPTFDFDAPMAAGE